MGMLERASGVGAGAAGARVAMTGATREDGKRDERTTMRRVRGSPKGEDLARTGAARRCPAC